MVLLEFTFLAKCIRGTDRIIAISSNNKIKAVLYTMYLRLTSFATLVWLSLLQSAEVILVAAVTLTIVAVLYTIAVVRGEDASKSSVVTQQGIARTVISRV